MADADALMCTGEQIISRETERLRQVAAMERAGPVCLLLLGIWLFAHPWGGIQQDAKFYAFLALSHLRPDAYRNDLFLLFGSQDDYTLFSPFYAESISLLGLRAATISLLLAAYLLWAGSAAWLLRGLSRGFPFWLGLVLIFAMPRGYGGYADQVRYAEPFLTPRLFAEGLTLLSLAMLLRGKWPASLAAIAAAAAMHPLMATAGAGFAGLYAAMVRPKLALGAGALGLGLLFGLVLFNIAPFDRLMSTMDSQWFELCLARSPFVFWDGWQYEDWLNRVLLSFSLLATAGIAAEGRQRRAFLAALSVGCAALLLTWLGTSLFHNLLLIQIQPWRALWLVQVFSWIAAAWLVGRFWHRGQVYRLLLLGFLTASLTLDHAGGMLALLAAGLFIRQVRAGREIRLTKTIVMLASLIPLLAATAWLATSWQIAAESASMASPADDWVIFTATWIRELMEGGGSGIIALALFLAAWRYGPDQRMPARLGAAAGILLLLLMSISFWYRPGKQELHSGQWAMHDPMPSFTRHMPIDAVVYWENDATVTWFALERANYASKLQTAGSVFSRQTAIEGKRRMDRLTALGQKDGIFDWRGDASRLPKASLEGLVHVCHDRVLDFVVLSQDFEVGVIERLFDETTAKHFTLYDCGVLRRGFADSWPVTNHGPATAGHSQAARA